LLGLLVIGALLAGGAASAQQTGQKTQAAPDLMEGRIDDLPTVRPGGSVSLTARFSQSQLKRSVADVLRPTGYSIASTEWRSL
jgi:hypothetical protein